MEPLVLTPRDLTLALEPEVLLDTMKRAFISPEVRQELTHAVDVPPASSGEPYEENRLFHLRDLSSGKRLVSMDADLLRAITAGVMSAVATNALARADASRVALIGTGAVAEWALRILDLVRHVRYVSVYDAVPFRAGPFLRHLAGHTGAKLIVADSLADVVTGADVVVMASGSLEPLLFAGMVSPGVHINALPVGVPDDIATPGTPGGSDLGADLLLESRVFSDGPEQDEGINIEHLGGIVRGDASGRSRPDEITVYIHAGLAWQDLIVGWHLYQNALAKGVGTKPDRPAR